MENRNQFDWVDFYRELADKVLKYKNNRKQLVAMVKEVYIISDISIPTLERDNRIVDIDPFTVFGLFNKTSMKDANRKKIISAMADMFGIESPMPTSFDSIPVLNNQNATFYYFVGDRGENDIDDLWELFESVLVYADSPTMENRERLSEYFDLNINRKGNGNSKITMGMYWIAPDALLNLDRRNIWYIYQSGRIPYEFVQTLPEVEPKIASLKYFEIVEKLRAYLESGASELKNFKELSFEAWRYSEEVNREEREKILKERRSVQERGAFLEEEGSRKEGLSQEERAQEPEDACPYYDKYDFLEEVYMDEDSYNALVMLLKNKKNIILQGAPGVGKTFTARRLAYSMMGEKDDSRVELVQFHQSYSYEDFIMGYKPQDEGFRLTEGIFYRFCEKAGEQPDKEYFFIIDEINRGNMSKIFGELLMLIEKDYRGVPVKLAYGGREFKVPENLYIIGMMNTADRSLAMIDYALRRRFGFYEMEPGFDSDGFSAYQETLWNETFDALVEKIKELNREIKEDDSLGEGFQIGHSYFCGQMECTVEWMKSVVNYDIFPMLREYWFDDKQNVKKWKDCLNGVFNDEG